LAIRIRRMGCRKARGVAGQRFIERGRPFVVE
jgi:hypothetical protein